jgi:NTP pyrophosphatase (non-canonical NTP hydrolase)
MEENRQLKDLLAQARSALADFMNTLECRQIEEREIRDQFGPMAARVGILTPEAHSMGYLAKELIPPILDQLTEALEYGRKTCVLADDRMSQIISLQVELEHLKGQGSNDQALFREVLHAWGRDAQINMAVEECAELVQALCHYRRQRCSAADVCNEIADVWILVLQLRAMFGEHLVMEKFRAKMHRLRLRLDERRVSVAGI